MFCPECGAENGEDSLFCPDCGSQFKKEKTGSKGLPMSESKTDFGFVAKVERSVYFKIARGFTWFIIFIATIALIFTLFNAGGVLSTLYLKKSDVVSREDVLSALEQKNNRASIYPGSPKGDSVDINLLNKLNAEINNTIHFLFTKEAQINLTEQEYEVGRQNISNSLTHWKNINERIAILKDLREKIKGIGKTKEKIGEAIGSYISIKIQKEESANNSMVAKYAALQQMGLVILATLIFISLATISLVLMAIERNTRKGV